MTRSNISDGFMRSALTAALCGSAMLGPDVAVASQGPGGGMGTASHLTQAVMAVLVYGTSAMVVAAGLIGALRGRPRAIRQ
ncbi:hypothetical protein ACFFWD_24450 [Bradyrhizobium erythrophlei]|uniref:hypothetical protein n=1 Tax=Bradyrhizobium erythrophlei TaxID=1437360 RepID=UPI0035EFEC4B